MIAALRTARGVVRSLRTYYGQRPRAAAMDRLYGQFVRPGDIAFDVGAHVGDRVAAFRRLGARVVAVEPQPALALTLSLLYGRDREVAIERVAAGREAGSIRMMVNSSNPTISTASNDFIRAADGAAGWEGQTWDRAIDVEVTTLDRLIEKHGTPAFIKIDVEGFEAEALAGLSRPVAALSFEFTTIQRNVAHACIERCVTLGFTRFNAAIGESQELGAWRAADETRHWLDSLPHAANSGDLYATMG